VVTTEPNFKRIHPRKLAFIFTRDVTKIRKTRVVLRVGIHLGARSCLSMYRMRESKSKLELFYRLFRDFFGHIFLALALNTCLSRV